MSTENKVLDLTFEAAEDLSDDQYRFMILDSTSGKIRRPDSASELSLGILQNAPESGGSAVIRVIGVSKLQTNAALAIGAFVKAEYVSAADAGKGAAATNSEEYCRGQVLEASGAEDDLCSVLLVPPRPIVTLGAGAANGATVAATEYGDQAIHKTVLTCVDTPLTFGDEAGQGQYGGVKVYDFPGGLICSLGATIDGVMTLTAPAIDTWDGDIGLGLEAPTDHQDVANKTGQIMPKVSTTQAVAKVATVDAQSVATALTESGARWLDGTTTAKDLFLNLLVDDNALHDNTIAGTFTGTITFAWINLGDNK